MKTISLKKLAAVSAIALTIGLSAQTASAAQFEMDGATPYTANVTAGVDNTADLVVTDVAFGVIGVTSDAVDTADLIMDPAGAITDDLGAGVGGAGEAHIVSETNTGTPGVATLSAGLANTQVFVYYRNLVDLTCGACLAPGNPDLVLEQIQDNLATPGSYTKSTATSVTGIGTTDATGALSWNIGATIQTVATANPYETGTYSGKFDIMLTY